MMDRFDLYLPAVGHTSGQAQNRSETGHTPRPSVIFITGGAWVIGCDCFPKLYYCSLSELFCSSAWNVLRGLWGGLLGTRRGVRY